MSDARKTWTPTLALPDDARRLLEASAGTGKTYQITHLVARLVAEHGLALEEILVITFTKAATAELRARVRRRLVEARDALASDAPLEDPALEALRAVSAAERATRRGRLDAALRDFDRAAISTIHGFCQRTLERFAFESDQAPGLEVVGDATELRDQLVADALARTYAKADEGALAVLDDMRWTRDSLSSLVKLMTGPVEPTLEPALSDDALARYADPLEAVKDWRAALDRFATWLDGPGGGAAIAALEAEASRKGKRVPGFTAAKVGKTLDGLREWLAAGGPRGDVHPSKASGPKQIALRDIRARFKWNADDAAWRAFQGRTLTDELDALLARQEHLCAAPLVAFGRGARAAFDAETRRRVQLTYDAMLAHLADALAPPARGAPALLRALRGHYRAALVDEFQDTDATQWAIIERIFGDAGRLYLIGDPKQSIYAFRNADLEVYRHAAGSADAFDMTRNHRSDEPLVQGLGAVWSAPPAPFGARSGIKFVEVDARWKAPRAHSMPAVDGRDRRAVELRWLDDGDPDKAPNKDSARAASYAACVDECRRLLDSGALVGEEKQDIHPGHLAVLVRTNYQAVAIQEALQAEGIPAVTGGGGSVFASEAQGWLCLWLDAVARPQDEGPARALAVSPLFGWSPRELAEALAAQAAANGVVATTGEADSPTRDWAAWRGDIARWAKGWPTAGFAAVFHRAMTAHDVYARLLASQVGERGATDLRHLAEVCHAEERRAHLSPGALAEWLRRRMEAADERAEEQALRLESDARAVQISTIHSAKGLQYPIVLLPLAWEPRWMGGLPVHLRVYPDAPSAAPPRYTLAPAKSAARERAQADYQRVDHEEAARLLYVAMTRAKHHLVAWQSGYGATEPGPLTRLLLPDGLPMDEPTPGDLRAALDEAITVIQARKGGDGVGWSAHPTPPKRDRWVPRDDETSAVAARPFYRARDPGAGWQRPSYSSLSKSWHTEAGDPRVELGDAAADATLWADCAGAALPGGIPTGDWLHKVMELIDFQDLGDADELAALVAREGRRHGIVSPAAHEAALALLPRWLATPLDLAKMRMQIVRSTTN